jgi:hypothetical protein
VYNGIGFEVSNEELNLSTFVYNYGEYFLLPIRGIDYHDCDQYPGTGLVRRHATG